MSTVISRRTVAWAVPAVAMTTAAPAFAVSTNCPVNAIPDSHIKIYDGAVGTTANNFAWFDFGSVTLTIPDGRTVASVTSGFWMQKNSGTSAGGNLGFPSPSSTSMKYYGPNAAQTGPTLLSTGAARTTGKFWNFRNNLRVDPGAAVGPAYAFSYLGEAQQSWADGSTGTGWGIETTWTAGSDARTATYVAGPGSCQTVTSPDLGGIQWVSQNTYVPRNRQLPHYRYWKVTLDDGTVLEGSYVRDWVGDPSYTG